MLQRFEDRNINTDRHTLKGLGNYVAPGFAAAAASMPLMDLLKKNPPATAEYTTDLINKVRSVAGAKPELVESPGLKQVAAYVPNSTHLTFLPNAREAYNTTRAEEIESKSEPAWRSRVPFGSQGTVVMADTGRADLLAHELGHAESLHNAGGLENLIHHLRNPLRIGGQIGELPLIAKALFSKNRTLDERRHNLNEASLIGGVTQIPTLLNEGLASRNGLRLLAQAEASPAQMAFAKRTMGLGGATYALGALAATLGPQLAKHFLAKPSLGSALHSDRLNQLTDPRLRHMLFGG